MITLMIMLLLGFTANNIPLYFLRDNLGRNINRAGFALEVAAFVVIFCKCLGGAI